MALQNHCTNVCWPNVWGEGALFAFSGMDGSTDFQSGFVATYGSCPGSLVWYTPTVRRLMWSSTEVQAVNIALGDAFDLDTARGKRTGILTAWHTLIGRCSKDDQPWLEDDARMVKAEHGHFVSEDREHHDVVVLVVKNDRYALSYGRTEKQALARARSSFQQNIELEFARRLHAYDRLPSLDSPEANRLLRKCFSVMRVNTYGPEGIFATRWSTPDRMPHRYLWLWDSAFHAIAMARFDTSTAWDDIEAVLAGQRPDGMVAHCHSPEGPVSDITQPPLLAWAVSEVFRIDPDHKRLGKLLPKLDAYLNWDLTHRDINANGLPEWWIGEAPGCRSAESGLDNSPRFDEATRLDAVDFSVLLCQDMRSLSVLYGQVKDVEPVEQWRRRADDMECQIHKLLWDTNCRGYRDRRMDGTFSDVDAITNLFPLLLDTVPSERVEAICRRIRDPQGYNSTMPLPSVALDDPRWSYDMWRGPTWLNTAYLVLRGLCKQNRNDLADELAGRLVSIVEKHYRRSGLLYEYYDATDTKRPEELDRKGTALKTYDLRGKISCIRDYHWTAAVTALLLLNLNGR